MCNPAAAVAAVGIAVSSAFTVAQMKTNKRNTQAQVNAQTYQYFRDLEFQSLQQKFQHQQFGLDMAFKSQQLRQEHQQFMLDANFRSEQLAYEIMQQEAGLEAAHLNQLSQMEYANDTMKAAWEAAEVDMGLLGDRWDQVQAQANLDIFERKRQAMKEQASVRVSQGESGIFGNTALKEMANSVMQASWDNNIIKWNTANAGKQLQAEAKKIKATAASRTNEALSGVVNRYLTGTAMNPAVAGIQIT